MYIDKPLCRHNEIKQICKWYRDGNCILDISNDKAPCEKIEAFELLEMVKDEFNRPIKNIYSAAVLLCMATSLGSDDCSNCPVTLFNCDKRTEYEKCCLHEPCQTNLYKWLVEQAKKQEV